MAIFNFVHMAIGSFLTSSFIKPQTTNNYNTLKKVKVDVYYFSDIISQNQNAVSEI